MIVCVSEQGMGGMDEGCMPLPNRLQRYREPALIVIRIHHSMKSAKMWWKQFQGRFSGPQAFSYLDLDMRFPWRLVVECAYSGATLEHTRYSGMPAYKA